MTDTLGIFAEQVTTVAREVGIEGKLGGQARVPGVAGTWKDLTDNVNFMASNLTTQVRGIVKVVTAVANGDLRRSSASRRRARSPRSPTRINNMTRHARHVRRAGHARCARGRYRRQARRPGEGARRARAPGAAHRQRQPARRQPHHAGARDRRGRHRGDRRATSRGRSRSRRRARSRALKDNINQMIVNLRETTQKNQRAGLAEDEPRQVLAA